LKVKISGIYNTETIDYLQSRTVNSYVFDLRPRSFNFIQEYKLVEIISSKFYTNNYIFLRFENEKNFVIEKIINNFKFNNVLLEFSGSEDLEFVEQFKKKFVYHFSDFDKLEKIILSKYLDSIELDYKELVYFYENNKLEKFVIEFFKMINRRDKDLPKIKINIKKDWEDEIYEGINQYFSFDHYTFTINNFVESSFRNIDLKKVGGYIEYFSTL